MNIAKSTLLALGALTVIGLTGCDLPFNTLEDGFVKTDPVTSVVIASGGNGDLIVRGDDAVKGLDVRRKVRYRGDAPAETAKVENGSLLLSFDCGRNCSVTYEIRVPRGVAVRGDANAGDVVLSDTGAVDITVNSGDVTVERATTAKVKALSGDIVVRDIAGDVSATANSGDITARDLSGATVAISTRSGDLEIDYAGSGALVAETSSGDVTLTVPDGACAISADADSGRIQVNATSSATGTCEVTAKAGSGDVTIDAR